MQPTFRDSPVNPGWGRATGVFSYTGVELDAVDTASPSFQFRRYTAQLPDLRFQVVAVWNTIADEEPHYQQDVAAMRLHQEWIKSAPTVIMGDFNSNASWKEGILWRERMSATEALGLVSAYHAFTGEDFGHESRPTHFFHGSLTSTRHIDYCFVPEAWVPRITNVVVGPHSEWSPFSDHAPVLVDLDI